MAVEYICNVVQAGTATGAGNTPDPEIQISLTDTNGFFAFGWFFAAETAKNQMLAVALAAISTQSRVNAWIDPPNVPITGPGQGPGVPIGIGQCYSLYIIA
jgi:hypothetical protein